MINKLLGCYRVVYNQCLARKIKSYEENKVSENLSTLGKFVHHELLKDDNFIWLREQNTKVLKQAVRDMLSAYKNFFKRHTGYPKFKSKVTLHRIFVRFYCNYASYMVLKVTQYCVAYKEAMIRYGVYSHQKAQV